MTTNPVEAGLISLEQVAGYVFKCLAENLEAFQLPQDGATVYHARSEKPGYEYMLFIPGVSGLTKWSVSLQDEVGIGEPIFFLFDILPTSLGMSAAFIRFVDDETFQAHRRGELVDIGFIEELLQAFEEYRKTKGSLSNSGKPHSHTSGMPNRAARRQSARNFKSKAGYRG